MAHRPQFADHDLVEILVIVLDIIINFLILRLSFFETGDFSKLKQQYFNKNYLF